MQHFGFSALTIIAVSLALALGAFAQTPFAQTPMAQTPVASRKTSVTSVNPSCSDPGKKITITGKHLSAVRKVSLNGKALKVLGRSARKITVRLPGKAKLGAGKLKLSSGSNPLATALFTVRCGNTIAFAPTKIGSSQSTVTAAGGEVSVKDGNGVSLKLTVPAGALEGDTVIKVTPLGSVSGLPFSKGVLGAVKFEPDGLQFMKPAVLQITLEKKPQFPVLGFIFSGPNNQRTLVPVALNGSVVELSVPHFSGAGAGMPSIADFVLSVNPILDTLGLLSVPAMGELIDILDAWEVMYPNFCQQPEAASTCGKIKSRILASIDAKLPTLCPTDLTVVPLPNETMDAIKDIVKMMSYAAEFNVSYPTALPCAEEIFKRVLKPIADEAKQFPGAETLSQIGDMIFFAATLGFQDGEHLARLANAEALDALILRAEELCNQDPLLGTDLLVEGQSFAQQGASDGFEANLVAAYTFCGVEVIVSPADVEISPGNSITFTAVVKNLRNQSVVWNRTGEWNSIDQEGVFFAGTDEDDFTVTATSALVPSKVGSADVKVNDPSNDSPSGPLQLVANCSLSNVVHNGPLHIAGAGIHTEGGAGNVQVHIDNATPGMSVLVFGNGASASIDLFGPHGSYNFTVSASDDSGAHLTKSITINVTGAPPESMSIPGGCDTFQMVNIPPQGIG